MTDADLNALDRLCQRVEEKATVGEPDYLPSAGGHHVLFSHAEYRLYMAARTALPQLVAEVRRLKENEAALWHWLDGVGGAVTIPSPPPLTVHQTVVWFDNEDGSVELVANDETPADSP